MALKLGIPGDVMDMPCPACGHSNDDHRRESWYDEEGIEGMSCEGTMPSGKRCDCCWWTWNWTDVINDEAMHEGFDQRENRIEGVILHDGREVEFNLKRRPAEGLRITCEPPDLWDGGSITIYDIAAQTLRLPFAFDVRKRPYRFFAEVIERNA